jgi:hypothetical protein
MSKKRKTGKLTDNLPENNRKEITALIDYINKVLLSKITEMEIQIQNLKFELVGAKKTPKFNLDLTDDED